MSAGYANLGALRQMRTEMQLYDPDEFASPSLDQIRREADLSQAEAMFGRALALDPGNRTALQRLAQIELSRGDYPAALQRMEAARQAGLQDEVTRLLTGDALVAAGDPLRAVQAVSGIPWAGGRLAFQGWYRYWLGEDYPRAADAWQAVVLLSPQDEEAKLRLEEARDRMGVWPPKGGAGMLDCFDIVRTHKESTNEQWDKTRILLRGSEMYYNGTVNAVTETDVVHMTGSLCHPTIHLVPHEIAVTLSNGQIIEGIGIIRNITFSRGEDIDLDVLPELLFVRESP
jgi:tetratricopeptide (TPR) repeat protein